MMKPEPIASASGAHYPGVANNQPITATPPSPTLPASTALPIRRPSVDQHGAMARQLRDSLRGESPTGRTTRPSSTSSSESTEFAPLRPVDLEAHQAALQEIETKAMGYLQQRHQARQEMLRSWPPEMTYHQVESEFQTEWERALKKAGHEALSADALPLHDQDQAIKAEEEMNERVGDHILDHFRQEGWFMTTQANGLKWGDSSPLTLLKHCDFDSIEPEAGDTERAGEHGIVRFLSTPLTPSAEAPSATAQLALKRPHGDGWPIAHREIEGYKKIIAQVGLHRNVMVALGEARVGNVSGVLFKKVPGSTGDRFLQDLKLAKDQGKLSEREFEQVLALFLDRGLQAIAHCHGAKVCFTDLTPKNIIIDENTGEPVFYDLGLHTIEGKKATGSSPYYSAPETDNGSEYRGQEMRVVDHRTDMFGLAASLADAVSGGQLMYRNSENGRVNVTANLQDADEQEELSAIRHPADAPTTPLWQFLARLMYKEVDGQRSMHKDDRMSLEEALTLIKPLRVDHDEAHALDIMQRLSREGVPTGPAAGI